MHDFARESRSPALRGGGASVLVSCLRLTCPLIAQPGTWRPHINPIADPNHPIGRSVICCIGHTIDIVAELCCSNASALSNNRMERGTRAPAPPALHRRGRPDWCWIDDDSPCEARNLVAVSVANVGSVLFWSPNTSATPRRFASPLLNAARGTMVCQDYWAHSANANETSPLASPERRTWQCPVKCNSVGSSTR